MVDERERENANVRRRAQKETRDNYQFILLERASHFRSVSKTVSIPEDSSH
jgi:hypothetical protein